MTDIKDIILHIVNVYNLIKKRILARIPLILFANRLKNVVIVIKVSIEQTAATDATCRMTISYTKLSGISSVAKDCCIVKSSD